jgi:L-lactate dehydrogenase complex protein LldG
MNGSREAILGRIREALREPAPRHHDKPDAVPQSVIATVRFREWLPAVEPLLKDRIAMFGKLSEMLRTEFVECSSVKIAADHLAALAVADSWKRLALHEGELCRALAAELPAGLAQMKLEAGYDKRALESCDAGLTECECLVAQTGSVCVTSPSAGGRALSVLPPHHVVVARRAQVLTDLTAAYELLAAKYGSGYPSFISFITGPSRTGDIERILVLGAHGPKKLTVLLVP